MCRIRVLIKFQKHSLKPLEFKILIDSEIGTHLCVSEDLLRIVFLQGHPEYDTISLLKEYKREIIAFLNKDSAHYPLFPSNYLSEQNKAILNEYRDKLLSAELSIADFPEALIAKTLNNTWGNATNVIINNWIGCVYQATHIKILTSRLCRALTRLIR